MTTRRQERSKTPGGAGLRSLGEGGGSECHTSLSAGWPMTQTTLIELIRDNLSYSRQTGLMQLDVESLRTFLAVLDWGSMTRAATQLGMSSQR